MVELGNAVFRLHAVNLRSIMHVIAEEVDGLASRVDFCLIDILALAQHRSRIHDGAILRCQQLGHLHHDGSTGGPRCAAPLLPCLHGGLNSHLHLFLSYFMIGGQYMLVVVRAGDMSHIACTDFLTADDDGDIDHQMALALQFFLKFNTLGRPFQVSLHRLVGRHGECDYRIIHCLMFL